MAKDKALKENQALRPVEEWADIKGTMPYIFTAVAEAAGWSEGRIVSESTYDDTLRSWLDAPMGGAV